MPRKIVGRKPLLADSFAVAWKRKTITKLTPDVVGHIPREISRAVYFLLTHGGIVLGRVDSSRYYPSPIAKGGLEILINAEFIISKELVRIIERLNSIIEENYKSPLASTGSIEHIDLNGFEKDENDHTIDFQVAIIDDENNPDDDDDGDDL